ncbi:MAG: hypothetical protein ABJO36_14195 [Litorimonas sp.]
MFKFSITVSMFLLASPLSAFAQEAEATKSLKVTTEWKLFSQIDVLRRQSFCPAEDYMLAKAELIKIYEADQGDRKAFVEDMMARDLDRRERVSKLAAKGCLFDQDDYWMAALVYQHGQLPAHFLQAIVYANKAADLKMSTQNSSNTLSVNVDGLQQVTIDRYLMSLGYKQLFGTQIMSPAFYKQIETEADGRPCVWPLDRAFDIKRDYAAGTAPYRQMLEMQISAKLTQFGECNFPARDSKHLLEILLSIKI